MIVTERETLRACCASYRWVDAVEGTYDGLEALCAASDEVLQQLTWPDVLDALAAHPRIGEAPTGTGTEAAWSRAEQSSSAPSADLATGNALYEQRFGFVYLICATGRSQDELLAALQERLTHDVDTERTVVRSELAAIVRLRLAKAYA